MSNVSKKTPPLLTGPLSVANTIYLCHTQGYVKPFWAERQLSPESPTFHPPIDQRHFSNTAYRSWTTLRAPGCTEHLTIDPVGMCSPNSTWCLDIWVKQDGSFFNLTSLPGHQQTIENEKIIVTGTCPGFTLKLEISIDKQNSAAGYLTVSLSKMTSALSLFLAIRPYGVTDVSPIRDITYHSEGAIIVNRKLGMVLLDPPKNILCLPFSEGDTATHIGRWEQILKTTCPESFATGYAEYRFSEQTGHVRVWLPLDKSFSIAHDLAKPLEKIQLKSWIQDFKNRHTNTDQHQKTTETPLETYINKQIYHLQQAENTPYPQEDPWAWLGQFGLLYWIPNTDTNFSQISQSALTQLTQVFKKKPTLTHAGIVMLLAQHIGHLSGEKTKPDGLQKIIKLALSLPFPGKELGKEETKNPFDHAFGKGPYWLSYFWASSILKIGITLIESGPQQEAMIKRERELKLALETALEEWAQYQQLPPMLPINTTRWHEPAIVTNLLSVFPLSVLDATGTKVSNLLLTLQNNFLHKDILFSSAHPSGYPIVENLLLAMTYLLREDKRCYPILDWVTQQLSPTGAFPRSVHPNSHMGADGDGHHLAASGLFLTVLRHVFIQEAAIGCHLFRMLPAALWETQWRLPHMRIKHGSISLTYTPESSTLIIENHCDNPLEIYLHLPDNTVLISETSEIVLTSGEKRQFVFSKT
jgi:hypothetical protein